MSWRLAATLCLLLAARPAAAEHAADAYFDPQAMAKSRAALRQMHGNQINTLILGERFEYQSGEGDPLAVWEGQGWIGGDLRKLWIKTEGEYELEAGRFEEAEVQALYSRAISPFWELQAGVRHDARPGPSRSYGVLGLQGLAPYWFELDGALFLSERGDLSARVEAEYEFRLTQRLFLQPRLEANLAFADDTASGTGSGLSTLEFGLRLRYEMVREFAPYLGVSWAGSFGDTKALGEEAGSEAQTVSWVLGLRFWF
jgi:copper resistance protein B